MKALRCNTVIRLILCSSQFTEAKSSAGCRWHLRTAGWPFLSFVLRFIGATEQISTGHLSDRFTVYARRGRRTFNSTGRSFILRADVERPNQLVHLAERVVVQEEFKVYSSVFVLILGNLMRLFLFLCSGRDHLCRVSFFFFFYHGIQCCLSPGHGQRKVSVFVISLSEANITLKTWNCRKFREFVLFNRIWGEN